MEQQLQVCRNGASVHGKAPKVSRALENGASAKPVLASDAETLLRKVERSVCIKRSKQEVTAVALQPKSVVVVRKRKRVVRKPNTTFSSHAKWSRVWVC